MSGIQSIQGYRQTIRKAKKIAGLVYIYVERCKNISGILRIILQIALYCGFILVFELSGKFLIGPRF